MQQLSLSFELNKDCLTAYLQKVSGKSISLSITENSYSMLSMKEQKSSVRLRLHWIFLSAGNEVLAEMGDYITNSGRSTPLIRDFVNQNTYRLRRKPPDKTRLRHSGRHHNLLPLFNTINGEYFNHTITTSITWGRRNPKRRVKRRTLGSYCYDSNVIRINPVLDSKRIPLFYLEFIIYHEMLHADLGIDRSSGRNAYHSAEFRRRERLFRDHERVLAMEKRDKTT